MDFRRTVRDGGREGFRMDQPVVGSGWIGWRVEEGEGILGFS